MPRLRVRVASERRSLKPDSVRLRVYVCQPASTHVSSLTTINTQGSAIERPSLVQSSGLAHQSTVDNAFWLSNIGHTQSSGERWVTRMLVTAWPRHRDTSGGSRKCPLFVVLSCPQTSGGQTLVSFCFGTSKACTVTPMLGLLAQVA